MDSVGRGKKLCNQETVASRRDVARDFPFKINTPVQFSLLSQYFFRFFFYFDVINKKYRRTENRGKNLLSIFQKNQDKLWVLFKFRKICEKDIGDGSLVHFLKWDKPIEDKSCTNAGRRRGFSLFIQFLVFLFTSKRKWRRKNKS